MKQMIYKNELMKREILYEGIYKDHEFKIISYQTHPCAYVEYKLKVSKGMTELDEPLLGISVHGGITFFDQVEWLNKDKYFVGWDYNHYGDLNGHMLAAAGITGKSYTTLEMYEDVKSVIEQLIEMENKEVVQNVK